MLTCFLCCFLGAQITEIPLHSEDYKIPSDAGAIVERVIPEQVSHEEALARISEATVRVTVDGGCGSGTIVGRTKDGCAIVLTNAHVSGRRLYADSRVQVWDRFGETETGLGKLVAFAYKPGTNVDWAVLKCGYNFANKVVPIPMSETIPESQVVTSGCPRCEWPSVQTLKMLERTEETIRWQPIAIPGRSGSGVFSLYGGVPLHCGLVTWQDGKDGLGQTSSSILKMMRGQTSAIKPRLARYEEIGLSNVQSRGGDFSIVEKMQCPDCERPRYSDDRDGFEYDEPKTERLLEAAPFEDFFTRYRLWFGLAIGIGLYHLVKKANERFVSYIAVQRGNYP